MNKFLEPLMLRKEAKRGAEILSKYVSRELRRNNYMNLRKANLLASAEYYDALAAARAERVRRSMSRAAQKWQSNPASKIARDNYFKKVKEYKKNLQYQ